MSKAGSTEQPPLPLVTPPLHESLVPLLRRCHLRGQQAFAIAFQGQALSPLQYDILDLVMLNPGIGHGALAEAMAAAPSVVTTAMKPLRAAGHVVLEETAGGDARRRGYRVSKAGNAFFLSVSLDMLLAEELLASALSYAERDTLKQLLLRLAESERL
jgi:DNA-binding MarR family transcriptional regulator